MKDYILSIGKKVLGGERINSAEAKKLLNVPRSDVIYLIAIANDVRRHFFGDSVELCTIINAKSGAVLKIAHSAPNRPAIRANAKLSLS